MKAIIIDSILCLLGIVIYFMNRYANRKQKTKRGSFAFWIQDNYPELISTVALNLAIMIIIHLPGTSVSFSRVFAALPFDLSVAGVPTFSFLLGLGLTAAFYRLFKAKTK